MICFMGPTKGPFSFLIMRLRALLTAKVRYKFDLPGDTTKRVNSSQKLQAVRKRLEAAPSKRNNNTEVIEAVFDFCLLMHTDRPGRQERFQHQHCESEFVCVRDHAESMYDIFVTTCRCMDSLLRLSASHGIVCWKVNTRSTR